MKNFLQKQKNKLAVASAVAGMAAMNANAALESVIPSDLATDQAVITGDIASVAAVLIAIGLAVLGVRKVLKFLG